MTAANARSTSHRPWWRTLLAGAALAWLAGCAQLVPQTMGLRTGWPAGVPQSAEIAGVPFHPQDEDQCGPAALATLLSQTGVAVTPEDLRKEVYLPARHGSLQVEMLAATRRHGRVPFVLAPSYADLLREVAAGHPVLVLQDVGALTTDWHYAVVYGFDYPSGTVYLRSGTQPRQAMSFTALERTWIQSGYWAMVAMPPGRIAATATEDAWMNAVLPMARVADPKSATTAFATALRRWPDNQAAAVGLANQLHAQGDLDAAAAVLREAARRHARSAIVANNLAQVLSDLGRHDEALATLGPLASDAANPYAGELRATRELILRRKQERAATAVAQ